MELPGLNFRPGKALEAAILQTHGTSVCVHPAFSSKSFFLVASFGRCKYKLTEASVATILQATIGGFAELFDVCYLSDRVYRFSVFSQHVGFHVYKLRSFECSNYKIFFNLWHGGGPDYISEFRRWCIEEKALWTEVSRKSSPSSKLVRPPLTGANSVPVRRLHGQDVFLNSNSLPVHNSFHHGRKSVFNRMQLNEKTVNHKRAPLPPPFNRPGILGSWPSPQNPSLIRPIRCWACSSFGHIAAGCNVSPRLARPNVGEHAPSPSGDHRSSMTYGPRVHKPRSFHSFQDFFTQCTGKCPLPPILVPWSLSWSIKAPEFLDEDDDEVSVAPPTVSPPAVPSALPVAPPIFSSFGEFARSVLGSIAPVRTVHVFWSLKTPVSSPDTVTSSLHSQSKMAFRLIDPTPFLPVGMQRQIVQGRPVMRRVVVGHVPQQNNDLAIVRLYPLLAAPVDWVDIRNVVEDFLGEQNVGFRSMQPCPFGQAYVRFNYMHERDNLIHNSPHPYGNGTISFIPHNRAWNNHTAVMSNEVWLMMLGLNLDLWTQPLVDKAVSSFGRLLIWEEDHYNQARAIVKVRVTSLDEIPWFFVFTEGTGFESDGWAVQCEILQSNMLGAAPQDEDFPPGDDDFNPNLFVYHGFGQMGQGPAAPPPPPKPQVQPNPELLGPLGWGVWPDPQNQANADRDNQEEQQEPEENVPNLIPIPRPQGLDDIEADINAENDVEEIIQAEEEGLPEMPLDEEGQILAMDDSTDSTTSNPDDLPPPLIDDDPDANGGNGIDEDLEVNQVPALTPGDNGNEGHENDVQVGMVRTLLPQSDPVFTEKYAKLAGKQPIQSSPEPFDFSSYNWDGPESSSTPHSLGPSASALRLWAKFFSDKQQGQHLVSIPSEWMNFFTLLLKGSSNEWATQFLKSSAWPHLASSSSGNCFTFSLPQKKPSISISELSCSGSDSVEEHHMAEQTQSLEGVMSSPIFTPSADQQDSEDSQVTPPSPIKKKGTKRGKKPVISESEVRRSERLHSLNKGFKPSTCKNKSCLGCDTKPPLISSSVVRDLGISFCKIDANKLTDEKLNAKPASKKAVSKPAAKKLKASTVKASDDGGVAKEKAKVSKAKKPKDNGKEDATDEGAEEGGAGPSARSQQDK